MDLTHTTATVDHNIHHHHHHHDGHGHDHDGGYSHGGLAVISDEQLSSAADDSNDGSDTIRDSVLNHSPIASKTTTTVTAASGSAMSAMSSSPVPMMMTMMMPLPQHVHTTTSSTTSTKTRGNGGGSSANGEAAHDAPLAQPQPPAPPRPSSQHQQHLSSMVTIEALRRTRGQRLASAAATRSVSAEPVASSVASGSDSPVAPVAVQERTSKPPTAVPMSKPPPQKDRRPAAAAGSSRYAASTTRRNPVVVSPVMLKPRVGSFRHDGADNGEVNLHQVPQRHHDQQTEQHQGQRQQQYQSPRPQQQQQQQQYVDDDDFDGDDGWNDPWIKSMTSDLQQQSPSRSGSVREQHHMFLDDGFPPVSNSAALWEADEAPTSNFFDIATTTNSTMKRTIAVSTPPRPQQAPATTANVVTPTHSSNFTASTHADSNNNTSYSSFSQNHSINTSIDSAFLPFSATQKVVATNSKSEVVRPQAHHHHPNHGNQVWTAPAKQLNHNRTGSVSGSIQSTEEPDFMLKSEGKGNSYENSKNKSNEMIEEHKSSLTPPLPLSSPIPPDAFSSYYEDNVYRREGVASPATALSADPFNVAFSNGSDATRGQKTTRHGERDGKEDMRKDAHDKVTPVKIKVPDHNNADITTSRSMTSNNKKENQTNHQSGNHNTSRSISVRNIRVQIKKKKETAAPPPKPCRKVQVVIKERLSILFADETSLSSTPTGAAKNDTGGGKGGSKDGPVCRVVGSIYARPLDNSETTKTSSPGSFYLTVRDEKSHIEQWDAQRETGRCRNVTAGTSHAALGPNDQVFEVSLDTTSSSSSKDQDLPPIMSYTCIPRLRPMPMLVKTKVHRKNNTCRVGIRIRANPQNAYVLTDAAVLMVVPFDMDGESVTMSRDGAIWDAMKRTLAWSITQLTPGETIDIQAQFKCLPEPIEGSYLDDLGTNTPSGGSFPVLASCNGNTTFSKIDVNTDYSVEDGSSSPVDLDIERSSTVLYRKAS
mmetsp:Transcript_4693/g.11969  ORF Transcript_4693/g.11969 Transcript_4693/m.11969 type:complete len:988 (+) Transcript_4693:139-3102(+)